MTHYVNINASILNAPVTFVLGDMAENATMIKNFHIMPEQYLSQRTLPLLNVYILKLKTGHMSCNVKKVLTTTQI